MPLKDLNSEQKKAATHDTGPLMIVAGAGTGKTTVITERIGYLIEQEKAKADEILALTFTDKAAGEMEERVDKLLPYGYTDLWIMTFHSFCQRVLEAHGIDIGLPGDFKLLNSTQQWMLVRQNLDKFNLDYYKPLGNPTKFIHSLIKHFSRCKDEEMLPEQYLEFAESLKLNSDSMESTGGQDIETEKKRLVEVANAYHTYQQLLLDNNSLDFGDLINYCLKLFKERPNILKKYQNQFKYILVDEFQDTNWAQYELVKLLVKDDGNITVVGDDDQSIYKFRGASVSNILQFKEDFPKSTEVYLNKNYRSSQDILDLSYNFIQLNNPERLEVKLKTAGGLSKKLISQVEKKGNVEYLQADDERSEVALVINKIIEIYNDSKEKSWNDFAVLIRANSQADSFLQGLRTANIPHTFVASKGLYSKDIIQDTVSYLKLLDNYHESMAMWRILNLPTINIAVEDLMYLANHARKKAISLYEACSQIYLIHGISEKTQRGVEKILKKISSHTKLVSEKGIKQVVLAFLKDFGYNQLLLDNNDQLSASYVNQLGKKIDEFESSFMDKSVKNFLAQMDMELESGESGDLDKEAESGPESVKVMTVHSAKGLEYKHVFIVQMVDKRFPSINRKEQIELPDKLVKEILPSGDVHVQEERRLFYVAMTRAKQGLYLSSALNYGGKTNKKPSRFLYETNITSEKDIPKEVKLQEVEEEKDKTRMVKYKPPSSFSFSALKSFETCPYQYYLQYVLKLPTPGKAVFSYGKTMHSTLQKFLAGAKSASTQTDLFSQTKQKTKLPSTKELLEIFDQSWIDDWYESKTQKEEYKKLGERSLKGFYQKITKEGIPKVKELEKGFNFKMDNYAIRGVIDRIDELGDGKVEIIDYKTGNPKTEKTIEKDQLLLYQLAAEKSLGLKVEKLTFHYLNDNSTVSFLGSEKELEKIQQKTLFLIEGIVTADWNALPAAHTCKYCDFNSICKHKL